MATNPIEFPLSRSLQIDVVSGDKTVVTCRGQLVRETANELHRVVKPFLGRSKHIVLDLGEVQEIDSSGLGALIALQASATREGLGPLGLRSASEVVKEILHSTNTLSAFDWVGEELPAASILEARREDSENDLHRNPDNKFREVD